jgi:ABC-type multidrug transport system fused ATPase/permease subunit
MTAGSKLFGLRSSDIIRIVLLGFGQVFSLVGFLLLLQYVVNSLTPTTVGAAAVEAWHRSLLALGCMAVLAVLSGWLRAREFSVAERAGYEVVRRLRMEMYAHVQGMTPRQVQGRSRGGLLLRFIGDLSMLRTYLSRGLLGGLVAVIVLVGTLTVLMVLNFWIGMAILVVLCGGVALSVTQGKTMRSATRTMRRRRSLVTSNIDEQLNALAVVQVNGRYHGEYERLGRQNDSLFRSLCRVAVLRGRLRGISDATGLLTGVAVLAIGMVEVRRGAASVGLVVASLTATRQLAGPVRALGLAHDYWHRSQVSRQKLSDFLSSSSRDLDAPATPLRANRGQIELRDVSVTGALDHICATVERGQLVGVTGPSGAGKSTLLGLVARLVEPDDGEIVVDGQPLSDTSLRSASRQIGMAGPDLPLMRGSILRNVTYRYRGADEQEVERVLALTGLSTMLDSLGSGTDAWVTEGGRNLSAGQRQRLILARALMGNPTILLLDEPAGQLGPAEREEFRQIVARHRGTTLLVSHDVTELALADQVWVMEQGRLVEVTSGADYADRAWHSGSKERSWAPPVLS